MQIEVTDAPAAADEAYVIAQTRAFNAAFTVKDVSPLCVFMRDGNRAIVAGLTGRTYWQYLEVQFLWVSESHRKKGHASSLMDAAESAARQRGCKHAMLDTYSFQALGFYLKRGYARFGTLAGYCGAYERYFLHKPL
jgi:ribosomal protein S18 acetylase RimI-like enzyme